MSSRYPDVAKPARIKSGTPTETSQSVDPGADAGLPDTWPARPRLISHGTLGTILLDADRGIASVWDALATWGEAQDLTWIE